MKVVELVKNCEESIYPIRKMKDFCIYDEYFLVRPSDGAVAILRQIEGSLYIIYLDSFVVSKWEDSFEELSEIFKVFCIPEYTGGSDGISENKSETAKARKELFEFLISRYMNRN